MLEENERNNEADEFSEPEVRYDMKILQQYTCRLQPGQKVRVHSAYEEDWSEGEVVSIYKHLSIVKSPVIIESAEGSRIVFRKESFMNKQLMQWNLEESERSEEEWI